jgi:hypothetical protein
LRLRGVAYFLVTAVLASALLSLANFLWLDVKEPASLRDATYMLTILGIYWAISFPFILVGGLAFGIPVHFFLRKAGRCRWHEYLFAGFIVGMISAVVLGSLILVTTLAAIPLAIYGAIAGGSTAVIWWWLANGSKPGDTRALWR